MTDTELQTLHALLVKLRDSRSCMEEFTKWEYIRQDVDAECDIRGLATTELYDPDIGLKEKQKDLT